MQCDVCPRFCTLHEGQRGLCFVRAREKDAIVLTTYGRSSGFCVDPIEKKPLHHFLPGSAVLSFGTAGCNLSCKFCQNWDISKSRQIDRLSDQASPDVIAQAARELGCESVAFTYNDPTIFFEYAIDVARACHEAGVRTVAVTAGYMCPEPREEFYRHIDAANVDLKAFTEKFYWEITGAHLEPVLDTLVYLKKRTNVWLEITNLVIPGHNDSDEEIGEMSRWVVENLGPDTPHALFRLSSGLEDARRAGDATVHALAGPPHRPGRRGAPCLHGQRRRPGGGEHVLPRLRQPAHRARSLRPDGLEPDRRPVRHLPDAPARSLRRGPRKVGIAARPVRLKDFAA